MSEAAAAVGTIGATGRGAAAGTASGIGFHGVTVAYKGAVALADLNLRAHPGEILAIIGPSGCGKTTALRAVAGFVRPTAGRIHIGETDVTDLPPYARDIGMVVQNYALFPHMRVDENVAFGLRARRAPDALLRERVAESLRMVGMADFATRFPRQLSGGQQQRVAIARALAIRPRVLLLDEPLSALDAQIRRSMLGELARLHQELPALTVLYVTHDQVEALTLADRIAIMRGGRLMAEGTSHMLYRAPPNRFAAEFLGRANLLPVDVDDASDVPGVARVRLGDTRLFAMASQAFGPGQALLCVRAHDLSLIPVSVQPANALTGTVRELVWQGDQHSIDLDVAGHALRVACMPMREPPAPGARIVVHFAAEDAMLIPYEDPARARPPLSRDRPLRGAAVPCGCCRRCCCSACCSSTRSA
jgi:2-aminoethylphosphonate transport system ATP-binding protein